MKHHTMSARLKSLCLLLLLLAVLVGHPTGHCESACAAPHCHAAACEHAELPGMELADSHRHLPCIHLSEGEVLLTRTSCRELHPAIEPERDASARLLRPRFFVAQTFAAAAPHVPMALRLPMLC